MAAYCPHCNHRICGYPYDNRCPSCDCDLRNAVFEYEWWKPTEDDFYHLIKEYVPEEEEDLT